MIRKFWIYLCLVAATVGVYGSVYNHEFIRYDDPEYILENRFVNTGITLENVEWAFKSAHSSNWHPVTWLSHMLDCRLFGVNRPGMHHLTNLLLHIVNVLLMFMLFERMTGARWRSFFVAIIFAVHPLHVESVAWISERKDVLSMMFWLMCLLSYVKYAKGGGRRWYGISFLLLTLGLMAKPMLVSTPFLLLLLDYWPLGRFGASRAAGSEMLAVSTKPRKADPATKRIQNRTTIPKLIIEKIPMLIVVFAVSVATYLVQRGTGAVTVHGPLLDRLETSLLAYTRYIGKFFWPSKLSPLYPGYEGIYEPWRLIGAAVVLIGVTVCVIVLRKKRYLTVGWLWYLGTLVPVIGIVGIGEHSIADRYMYMPMTGLLIMITWLVADACKPWKACRVMAGIGAAAVIGACMITAHAQVGYWKDSYTLFNHAIHVTKNNYVMQSNLGTVLYEKGRTAEAIRHYQEALRIKPDHFFSNNNLGNVLLAQGRTREAIAHFRRALRAKPDSPEVHNNLGNALASLHQLDEAIRQYRMALRIRPDYAMAHNNLGIALAEQNHLREAVEQFRKALSLNPDNEAVRKNLERAEANLNDSK